MTRFIIIFLFLTMAVALFFGQSRSYFSDITALKTEKQTLDEALAQSAESQKLKNQLLSQYNAISQGDIGRLGKLMPSQTDSGSLIIMLEDRVKAHGLLLKKIDVSNVKQSEESLSSVLGTVLPYESINLSFSISGPYDSILELLADLEASLRVIDVNNIGFSSGATDFYEFNISAKTYSVSGPATVAVSEKGGVKEILSMLTNLKSIKIDTGFFSNDAFKSLNDFVPSFELPKEYGRPNPFTGVGAGAQ